MFDLETYLQRHRRLVEQELDRLLPPAETPPVSLHEAMRYAVLGGGKRVRAILCLAAAEAVGAPAQAALPPALALELFHTYTLIHDDLPAMDDDRLRRGKPTCHIAFGEANAILAGDALLTLSFQWLAEAPPPPGYEATAPVRELARAGGHRGVIAGQVEDLASEGEAPTPQRVEFIHLHKTGLLIRAAIRLGAMAAGAAPSQFENLSRYGEKIGIAFQVADDILNATSTESTLGKAAGSDEARSKMTYVAVHGLQQARQEAEQLVQDALDALAPLNAKAEALRALAQYIVERTH